MPVKLIPNLRLLNPTLPLARLSSMKPITAVRGSTRAIPIFSRIFPHKIKYQLGFPTSLTQPGHLSVRRLSTRAIRNRPGSSGEVRAAKSLIDDEAELSDWVSGLKSDPLKTRVYSSDDNDYGRGRDSDRSRGRDDRGGRDRVQPVKRRRDSDSDDGPKPIGRDSYGSLSRNSPPRPGREMSGRDDRFGSRRDNGPSNDRFGARRDNGPSNDRFGSRRDGGPSNDRFGSRRDSGPSNDRFGSRRDSGPSNDRFGSRRDSGPTKQMSRDSRGEARPSRSFLGKEDGFGRPSRESGQRRENNAVASKNAPRRGGFATSADEISASDEDEERKGPSKSFKSFTELISEEDSDDDDVDFEDEEGIEDDDTVKDDVPVFASKKASSSQTSSAGGSESYLSESRFDQCSVSPLSLKGIKDAGYEKMTVVQAATLPLILRGKDVLAKAKTGTGKTVAFLLPSIEVVVKSPPVDRDSKRPPILVLVICPTRELANQAAAEANKLIKYHPSIGVQVVIGGTRLALEQKRIQSNPCQILVATPGRLKDHIENTSGFATKLMGVKVLVLDEADHLLDMGFRKDIERIIAAVPKQRQTLLFSATVPPEVRQICHIALKRDHDFVDTVGEDNEQTHAQVRQMHLVSPLDNQFPLIYALLKEHISDDVDYKVLVFCTTAMVTRLVANFLGELNLNVREIHSRKPQSYRTRVSDEFRKSKGIILVTSDVSARGVDYPDVTLVIQVGLPSDREQYIHRLGRTGRKGREGQGVLVLAPWEEFFLSSIKDLPISKAPVPSIDPETRKKVERALAHVEMKNKEAAYQAWLGYYNSNKTVARDKSRLVELANDFSRSMGLDNPPAIPKLVLGKMGLRNVPGLRSK